MQHCNVPREPRPQFPSAVYHVTARGVRRSPIFTNASERRRFLAVLGEAIATFSWQCFAYCLMGNHYHLVVATPTANISAGMHRLNGAYARWFNRVHGHKGHLFQDRFHSQLVERDSHLLEACRYTVLNPVRAGLVPEPADWAWSSYRATIAAATASKLVAVTELLELFGSDAESGRRRFQEFVREGNPNGGPSRHVQVPGTGTWL
jgi:REP-associated tyrosine transposase